MGAAHQARGFRRRWQGQGCAVDGSAGREGTRARPEREEAQGDRQGSSRCAMEAVAGNGKRHPGAATPARVQVEKAIAGRPSNQRA